MKQHTLTLVDGSFSAQEAIDIVTKLFKVKIEFHENKIKHESNAEDIKMREKRIKQIQNELLEFRHAISSQDNHIQLKSLIEVSK